MGIDKADVVSVYVDLLGVLERLTSFKRYVVHYDMPTSIEG